MEHREIRKPKIVQLVYCPFTGVGIRGYSGDDWYKYRIEIFKNYTLKSLANQTEKNFILWLSFRPQEKDNPLTAVLADIIKEHGLSYVMTFDGLMYHDDRFNKGFVERLWNTARIFRKCWRDKDFSGVYKSVLDVLYNDKNDTLPQRLGNSLKELKKYFSEADWVYMTRVDSDDMFHREAFSFIHEMPPKEKTAIVGSGRGLFYNKNLDQLAVYLPTTNPPFHTIMFPAGVFLDPISHMEYMSGFRSHEDIPKIFDTILLPDFYYCVFTDTTKHRISTTWNHAFKGKIVGSSYNLKEDFGI